MPTFSPDNLPDQTFQIQTCEGNVTIREIEIQEQLETLYALLKVFDEPLPADVPFTYAVEDLSCGKS